MAQGRKRGGTGGAASRGKGARASAARHEARRIPPRSDRGGRSQTSASAPGEPALPFRLGAIPGATPGKWIDTWNERMRGTALVLVPLTIADQRAALVEGDVDAAIVRLPIDRAGLAVIPLYDEIPVVVCSTDSHLTAADDLEPADLAGEVVISPHDDVLGPLTLPGTVAPVFDAPETTADAVATVATGVGVVVVPMSLARLHHRRDVTFRPLRGGPVSPVALAWREDRDSAAVQTFIGIVRGRTARSSRA